METAQKNIQDAEREFERIRHEITAFKARMLSIYREHLSDRRTAGRTGRRAGRTGTDGGSRSASAEPEIAPQEPAEEPAFEPVVEPAAETEEPVPAEESAARGVVLGLPILKDEDAAPMETEEVEAVPAEQPAESRFGDLKFGDDYDISKDNDDEPGFSGVGNSPYIAADGPAPVRRLFRRTANRLLGPPPLNVRGRTARRCVLCLSGGRPPCFVCFRRKKRAKAIRQ